MTAANFLTELPNAEFVIVFDGDCPVCVRFFPQYVRMLKLKYRVLLVDAREHPQIVDYLLAHEHIDIDRDAAIFTGGRWYAGHMSLSLLFEAATHRSPFVRRSVTGLLAALYPVLRYGRLALLFLTRRSLIRQRGMV